MNKEQEVEEGRKIYRHFKNILTKSKTLQEALEVCGFETYVWDEDEAHNGTVVCYNINLIGEEATINVIVDVYNDNRERVLDEHFELVSRETDDWDGLFYGG